jgi:hypothetical protein
MKQMADEHLNADAAIAFLRQIYMLEGADAAVQAPKEMIYAGRRLDCAGARAGRSAPHPADCRRRTRERIVLSGTRS